MNELKVIENELVPVYETSTGEKVVYGTELHEKLEVKTKYADWIVRRFAECEATENEDFEVFLKNEKNYSGGRPSSDHIIKLDTAKEMAMLERNDKGKEVRRYFIKVEKKYKAQMDSYMISDPVERAKRWIEEQEEKKQLEIGIKVRDQQISELQPKASYYDVVLNCKEAISITVIAKDYGMSGQALNKMLHDRGIQYKQKNSDIWLLYQKYAEQGYTCTKTSNYLKPNGETGSKVHTYWTQKGRLFIYSLLKQDGILPMVEREEIA